MDCFEELKTLKEIKKFLDWFLESQGFCVICNYDNPLDLEGDHIGAKAGSVIPWSRASPLRGRICAS